MSDNKPRRSYHTLNTSAGYPAGSGLFYECKVCGEVVPSLPSDSAHCKCRNIMIDVDYGRIAIQDEAQVKLFSLD